MFNVALNKGSEMLKKIAIKSFYFFVILFLFTAQDSCAQEMSAKDYAIKAWELHAKKDYAALWKLTQECIDQYEKTAKVQQSLLAGFAPSGSEEDYPELNSVAVCYFIRGEALMQQGKLAEAKETFQYIIDNFAYAQFWDPRGWYWKVAQKAKETIDKINTKKATPEEVTEKPGLATVVTLIDTGTEEVVDYSKYGKFIGRGSENYRYRILDRPGLAAAAGEGIYPNTSSVLRDPGFRMAVKAGRLKGNHWDFLRSNDLEAAFYKWSTAPEPPGVRLFYTGMILEKAGLLKHAIKAYYAIVVHFPGQVGWTYWHTPWYVGQVAIAKINYITRRHPELGLKLVDAEITIKNSYDNDPKNDSVICNPGRIVRVKPEELKSEPVDLNKVGIAKEIGKGKVRLVKFKNHHWQLLVDGKPYQIRGVTYTPTKVGQSPDEGTLKNWMEEDYNKNGKIDGPYDAFVDKNRNNIQDKDEISIGDFQLMKEMGVNTIRLYHHPAKVNKELLRDLYKNYGIGVIMGDFLGAYTIGSGASWYEGTDYSNPEQQKSMLASVEKMVREFKNEPYILFWLLVN
jgi:tetratricopeptide (TPR) repeat protein